MRPDGLGKTTTLYSALSEINSPDKNILTIEDPIEYELKGIGQAKSTPIDLTFASVLRAPSAKPDIILVGETRDKETADNAIQASLARGLLDAAHNDAPGAFTRLIDMGVEPFLVPALYWQSWRRGLCVDSASTAGSLTRRTHQNSLTLDSRILGKFFRAGACDECNHKGYSGRSGI